MKPKHKRLTFIIIALLAAGLAVWLLLSRFGENVTFFYAPSDIARLQKENPERLSGRIRAGGLIKTGSVTREKLITRFAVYDGGARLTIEYTGLLPTLFEEEQGMIAAGVLNAEGVLIAEELLAKHDENYMPPEVADALKKTDMPGYSQ